MSNQKQPICKGSGRIVKIGAGEVFCRSCFWHSLGTPKLKRSGKPDAFGSYAKIPTHSPKDVPDL